MNPADALYTVFIWPVHFVIEFLFLALKEIFAGNMGLVIIFTGIIVNTLLLPLYNVAEEWQNGERSTQKRMKPVLSRIRRFYRGDERQMLIAAYYKQARYSPLNMLRSTSGFLLQIPFFIAAYQFLSHTSSPRGHSFLFIKDLGAPDGIFAAPLFTVNVLPLIMTVFNLLSAAFYIRGFSIREKIQLFSMPAIFLVLLYNFPSGMVLYWTVNNMFSLGKNLTIRFSRNPSRFLYYLYAGCLLLVIFVLAAGLTGINRYRTILIFVCVFSLFIPLLAGKIFRFLQFFSLDNRELKWFFFAPLLLLTLVTGVIAPVQLISSSSPEDFSRPVSFLSRTFLQSCAFFLFLPLILWLFSSRRVKYILAPLSVFLGITGTLCYFFFSTLYGTMTRSFKFENTHHILDAYTLPFNLVLVIPGVLFVLFILFYKNKKRVAVALQALVFGFFLFGAYSFFVFITNHDKPYAGQAAPGGVQSNGPEGFFRLSSTGNNVFYLFLDRASGVAFYDVLEFLPELREKLDGFTFYPNTLSFANYTVSGLSAVFGGYEYAPSEINKRADKSLEEAINEGFSILPSTGGETGKKVFILNPPIADSRSVPAVVFFNQFNNVTSIDLNEYFTGRYKRAFPQGEENFFESFDYDIIFRYGLFRTAPPLFRYAIYYNGKWWRDGDSSSYEKTLPEISALRYLSEMCAVDTLGGGRRNHVHHAERAYA